MEKHFQLDDASNIVGFRNRWVVENGVDEQFERLVEAFDVKLALRARVARAFLQVLLEVFLSVRPNVKNNCY